jgi:hypothetical protein
MSCHGDDALLLPAATWRVTQCLSHAGRLLGKDCRGGRAGGGVGWVDWKVVLITGHCD